MAAFDSVIIIVIVVVVDAVYLLDWGSEAALGAGGEPRQRGGAGEGVEGDEVAAEEDLAGRR